MNRQFVRHISTQRKEEILDKLHRGFVNVCLGLTVISGTLLCYKTYEYFRYIRPLHKAMQERAIEEAMPLASPVEILDPEELKN